MKKILIMGDYFFPDVASTGQILTELCLELQDDFKITVLTSVPSASSESYSNKINNECLENINVVRIKTKPFDKRNKFSRIKHVIEHYFLTRKAIRNLEKQDIVFTISQPPIIGGLQGRYAKRIHKARLVYNIQDFNPEQAEAVAYFKFKLIYGLMRRIDRKTCKKADKIVVVGKDMLQTLEKRGFVDNQKTSVINNWIDEKLIFPQRDEKIDAFKLKYDLMDKLVIMYSGNIGLYYDLENLIAIFGEFRDKKDVVFAFVGDGAKKDEIENWVKENKIENVRFIPYQDKSDLNYSLNSADIHLVVNMKGIKGVSVPSKIYGVMAAAKYVFGVLEEGSEAYNLIKDSHCGIIFEPGDYNGIRHGLEAIMSMDKDDLDSAGNRGREYLEGNLAKSKSIQKYRELFNEI